MSFFICVSIPVRSAFDLDTTFPSDMRLVDVSDSFFGQATIGQSEGMHAYLVTHRGCSTDIMDKGPKNQRCSARFISGVAEVLKFVPELSFLIHVFRGDVRKEKVTVKRSEVLKSNSFIHCFPKYEADVRYVVERA